MSKAVWIVIVAIILVGGVWYFASQSNTPNGVGPDEVGPNFPIPAIETPVLTGTTATSTPVTTTSAIKEFTVTGKNFSFTPTTMTVNKGDTVKITFNNSDGTHDFKIDEFNVATKRIGTGESDSVTFVADKAGTFEYYCSVGQHRAMGMKGTLVVN